MVIAHDVSALRNPERNVWWTTGVRQKRLVAASAGDELPKVKFLLFRGVLGSRHDCLQEFGCNRERKEGHMDVLASVRRTRST